LTDFRARTDKRRVGRGGVVERWLGGSRREKHGWLEVKNWVKRSFYPDSQNVCKEVDVRSGGSQAKKDHKGKENKDRTSSGPKRRKTLLDLEMKIRVQLPITVPRR